MKVAEEFKKSPGFAITDQRGSFLLYDLGFGEYEAVYKKQKEIVEAKKKDRSKSDVLVFVEHPDVYTYGRKSSFLDSSLNGFAIERGGEASEEVLGRVCGAMGNLR